MRLPSSFPGVVLFAGLIVGTLDILSAMVYFTIVTHGQPISKLLAYVGSGVFGKAAFSGDPAMPWWGLLFHYCIAMIWTFIFFLLYPKITVLRRTPAVVTGIAYGAIVWCIMNLMVVPLSHVPHGPMRLTSALINMAILMVMIGIPLSLIAKRWKRYSY
ncbi:hypothetical protein ACTJJ0_13195 [Chitinophaga sp. 22321]|uniref:DUF1440 domain-containing protein n=1 Tax=Chitinophaga hostae TaxID=2831022 RepID=A0ABS5J101_9BACT|nr:hypothetical protein [Chitinophaga hostae]MBS0028897.1 hypothetical protein [Chitinophaga hostae]